MWWQTLLLERWKMIEYIGMQTRKQLALISRLPSQPIGFLDQPGKKKWRARWDGALLRTIVWTGFVTQSWIFLKYFGRGGYTFTSLQIPASSSIRVREKQNGIMDYSQYSVLPGKNGKFRVIPILVVPIFATRSQITKKIDLYKIETLLHLDEREIGSSKFHQSIKASFSPMTLEKQCRRAQVFVRNCGAPDRIWISQIIRDFSGVCKSSLKPYQYTCR